MKKFLKQMKQFIVKHDELFFILIFFILIFGITVYIKTIPTDEVWNFQNIYKMYSGYRIYIDANVITTPLFHVIGVILFKLFGANFLIFKLYAVLINLILFFAVYKIFKALKIPKYLSLFLTAIMFVSEINTVHNTANYNNLCLSIVLFGILIVLNRYKYADNKFILLEALVSFCVLMTKQNIGVFYIIGFMIYILLYKKEDNKLKNILKFIGIIIFLGLIFLIILYRCGILEGFISYCVLGIGEFAEKNVAFEVLIFKLIGISIIGTILIYFFNKKKVVDDDKIQNINNVACFAIPLLMIAYPIFNVAHVDLALFVMYVLLMYIIYLIFLDMGFNKKIICKLSIILIIVLSIISIIKTGLYFYEIDYNYEYNNIYFGALLQDELEIKIGRIVDYINKSEEEVIVFSTDAALYMMPLNRSNGNMDEPLLGNFGKNGEDGVIKEIANMRNTKIMINKEKNIYQESDKIIQYIKDNLIYVDEIEDLLIYKTKK